MRGCVRDASRSWRPVGIGRVVDGLVYFCNSVGGEADLATLVATDAQNAGAVGEVLEAHDGAEDGTASLVPVPYSVAGSECVHVHSQIAKDGRSVDRPPLYMRVQHAGL